MRLCLECSGEIPSTAGPRVKLCSDECRAIRKKSEGRKWAAKKYKADPTAARSKLNAWRKGNIKKVREKERERYQIKRYGAHLDTMTYKEATAVKRGILYGYRSGLEQEVAKQIEANGKEVLFETDKIPYVWPARNAKYTPDFKLFRKDGSFFYVETKGLFETKDRQKHVLLKEQGAPEVRFVFSRSKTKISKGSPTSYGKWCDDHGFQYSDKSIPDAWFNE
jgi:hypothetical protein